MSIKNDIEMVREELTSEEKFFEKSVITERFLKKYKNMLIAGVVGIVVLVSASIAYEANIESRVLSANEALIELEKDSTNAAALSRLASLSPSLHDAFVFSKAMVDKDIQILQSLQASKALMIADLATYELSTDKTALETYALKQDSIYKDLAQLQSAILLMNEGEIDKAHEKLLLVSDTSSLSKLAHALLHYGVK